MNADTRGRELFSFVVSDVIPIAFSTLRRTLRIALSAFIRVDLRFSAFPVVNSHQQSNLAIADGLFRRCIARFRLLVRFGIEKLNRAVILVGGRRPRFCISRKPVA